MLFYLILFLIFSIDAKTDDYSISNKCLDYYKKLTIISSNQEPKLDEIIPNLNNTPLSEGVLRYIQNTNLPFQISPKTLSHIFYGEFRKNDDHLILYGGLHTMDGFQRLLSIHSGLNDYFKLNPQDMVFFNNGVTWINFPQDILPQQKTSRITSKHFFPDDWDQLNIVKKIALIYQYFSHTKKYYHDKDRFSIEGSIKLNQKTQINIRLIFFIDPLAPRGTKPTLITAYPI